MILRCGFNSILWGIANVLFCFASTRAFAGTRPADLDFFEARVRPVLAEHCYKCHSAKAEKVKADLRLDSRQAMLRGGKSGAAIIPGHPETSLLIKAVRYTDPDLQMPAKYQLPKTDADDLARWVAIGAPWPGESDRAAVTATKPHLDAQEHWAFQPVRPQKIPAVQNAGWPRKEIDRFILARLESKGLSPSPPADRRTLIRRAYFDLIGLPPSPQEVEAFARNDSPGAYAELIDHLLASPHYGERWGRYWLDLARYADTNGADENYAFPNAWRYRDYVVRSLNADKPYDRFITEQLAGDLLENKGASEAELRDRIIATGFLVLGPKMLAEQDKPKLVMDLVDEQIDVMGQTFLGLTLGCARCHDHKFDPIPTADYYALAGIFKSTQTMANLGFVSEWVERDLPDSEFTQTSQHYAAALSPLKTELEAIETRNGASVAWTLHQRLIEWALTGKSPAIKGLKPTSLYPSDDQKQSANLRSRIAELEKTKPLQPRAMSVLEGKPQNVPIHLRGNHLTLAKEPTPRGFVKVLDRCETPPNIPSTHSGRLELAQWIANPANPLTARVMVNRIWQGHFGRGLVSTPSNFGLRGATPSHPELLDWLADQFVRSGWSIKQMHRLIMLSAAYQMNSNSDPHGIEIDAENSLLWRQNRRRLEAEPIRDALLAVGRNLDLTIGGSLAKYSKEKYNAIKENDPVFDSTRRAIYLPIVRSRMYDQFTIFDYVDAGVHLPARPVTTVPQQALFMLNSDLVMKQSNLLARKIIASEPAENTSRLRLLYETLYARPPSVAELTRSSAYLASVDNHSAPATGVKTDPPQLAAWSSLCRILLAANEFVYVN